MTIREALERARITIDLAYCIDPELVGCNLDYEALEAVIQYASIMIPVAVPEPEGDFNGWQDVIDAGEEARKALQEKMNK
jgi:hypothetical protein